MTQSAATAPLPHGSTRAVGEQRLHFALLLFTLGSREHVALHRR
jgi:hypothetical protein